MQDEQRRKDLIMLGDFIEYLEENKIRGEFRVYGERENYTIYSLYDGYAVEDEEGVEIDV